MHTTIPLLALRSPPVLKPSYEVFEYSWHGLLDQIPCQVYQSAFIVHFENFQDGGRKEANDYNHVKWKRCLRGVGLAEL